MATRGSESGELDDFWSEINAIEAGKGQGHCSDDELSRTPDEGEQESAWLTDAGYGHLVSKFEEGRELADSVIQTETNSLTRAQAAAVKKRVETLNTTLRKRKKLRHKADVRDIFNPESSTDGNAHSSAVVDLRGQEVKGREADDSLLRGRSVYCVSSQISVVSGNDTKPTRCPHQKSSSVSDHDVSVTFPLDRPVSPRQRHKTSNGNGTEEGDADTSQLTSHSVARDALGVTHADDLSKADLAKIRALTLIELTALYDIYNISYIRRKPKKRLKDHGVFGVPLQTLLEQNMKKHRNLKVPIVFKKMMDHLENCAMEEEGILRIPGSVSRVKSLRQQIEDRGASFDWSDVLPHDTATLLKQFLRELPIPLLTYEYLDAFSKVDSIPDLNEKLQALILLVLLLPDVHRHTLQMLLHFLAGITDHRSSTRMTVSGVAMIMTPNLFLPPARRRDKGTTPIRGLGVGTANVVKLLLLHRSLLCTVPSFMVSQIRHQYEAEQLNKRSKENRISKLLGRKDKAEPYRKPVLLNESDYLEAVIRVQAPKLAKFNTAIQLDSSLTAGDIVDRFNSRIRAASKLNGRLPSDDMSNPLPLCQQLYEVGGNIGERRLDSRAKMLMLYRVNPNAQWIVRAAES